MNYAEKIDYSSLSTADECMRKFLYQYIFHFRPTRPSIHLVFGACWHYGLEIPYQHLMNAPGSLKVIDAVKLSCDAFDKLWLLEGAPHFPNEDMIFPKSPGHAYNMYHKYWTRYLDGEDRDKEIIAVESPFVINLSTFKAGLPNYIGRQDLIFKLPDRTLEIIDHKTAKALWKTTLATFQMSYQTDGYLTSGHIYYDTIPKMTYSIALCQKTKIDFHRFTIVKRRAAIEQFLKEVVSKIERILEQIEMLPQYMDELTSITDHLPIFDRSPGYACTAFMQKCPYFDLCFMRVNPLLWLNKIPQGFTQNEWDPDKHDEEMRAKLKQVS